MSARLRSAASFMHGIRFTSRLADLRFGRASVWAGFPLLAFVFASALIAQGPTASASASPANRPGKVQVQWFGHSYFLITSSKGLAVAIDPFDKRVGYPVPKVKADIVAVTHRHFDHDAVGNVGGNPEVLIEPRGERTVKGASFKAVKTFHDDEEGRLRGPNTVICFEIDGIRFCHLGDLGHELSARQAREIGAVDILFIPVGGNYTIDADQAAMVVAQLKPRIAVPMHYRTARTSTSLSISGADRFVAQFKSVRRIKGNSFTISAAQLLEQPSVWIFDAFSR
jgi:L-ascorbate metabolism protein UlaG (beta-lactamase superfamily)